MRPDEALPPIYALALRLRDEGHDVDAIAARLGIEPESLEPLLRIAAAKLASARRLDEIE